MFKYNDCRIITVLSTQLAPKPPKKSTSWKLEWLTNVAAGGDVDAQTEARNSLESGKLPFSRQQWRFIKCCRMNYSADSCATSVEDQG